jgi:hypothetical protein
MLVIVVPVRIFLIVPRRPFWVLDVTFVGDTFFQSRILFVRVWYPVLSCTWRDPDPEMPLFVAILKATQTLLF